jgi:adenosylcobyric acid synthase
MNANKVKNNKAKAIMVVGTSSDSGKTLVAAALCRYFQRKGVRVAPYKAQNMALNSFVTEDGGEMGRAQVMQCEAAKIKPHTDMNPVLLKPQGNIISQVIVNGKLYGNISAHNYYKKKQIARLAREAYDRLSEKYELIIMEGAGSPAEINILKSDFVNMSAAEYANAKTILVADIDRGGVFASIYGTIKLLPKKYQKLFYGIIINKFRGDLSLLSSGIKKIEILTGIPVLGVLPFEKHLQLDEEDSLALDKKCKHFTGSKENLLDIGIIRLPYISNYTDFLPFEKHPQVMVRYIEQSEDFDDPDLIIIPGTKSTCSDMQYLIESKLSQKIIEANQRGIPIIGICGGYQILGKIIYDPFGVEGVIKEIEGLCLLDIETTIKSEKELAQVEVKITPNFPLAKISQLIKIHGYEIHCGNTLNNSRIKPLLITKQGNIECKKYVGSVSEDKTVFGCYVHGLFDSPSVANSIVSFLANKRNLRINYYYKTKKDVTYNKLADLIKQNVKHLPY